MKATVHTPVLFEPVLHALRLRPGMTVVDATLGGGGYALALLERVLPGGRVMAFDWDHEAIARFRERTQFLPEVQAAFERDELILLERDYAELSQVLSELGGVKIDAIVADLGLSSDQLDDVERGLSFRIDGPLDMRLDRRKAVTAADIINEWSESALADVFRTYGDEPEASRIARRIVRERLVRPITRSLALAVMVAESVAPRRRRGCVHPATQVFQALRLVVNGELASLERFLPQAVAALRSGGRLAVVSFHSGEDALVKHFIRDRALGCTCNLVPCQCGRRAELVRVTKKPILPTATEIERNPRSRSAKLRVTERA